MKKKVSLGIMFLKTSKKYETLKGVNDNERNIFRVFGLYECFFLTLKHERCLLWTYYSILRGIIDELEVHQFPVADLKILKEYQ